MTVWNITTIKRILMSLTIIRLNSVTLYRSENQHYPRNFLILSTVITVQKWRWHLNRPQNLTISVLEKRGLSYWKLYICIAIFHVFFCTFNNSYFKSLSLSLSHTVTRINCRNHKENKWVTEHRFHYYQTLIKDTR